MKTKLPILIIIGLLVAVAFFIPGVSAANSATGNGAMSGQHFTLNIIGQKNVKNMPDGLSGHVIFCPMNKGDALACRIYLAEGADFAVLDKDGTDGVARFMLPNPYADIEDDVTDETAADAEYRIYVRVLGKPGGSGSMKTGLCETVENGSVEAGDVCIDDENTWWSATNVTLASHNPSNKANPRQKFVDVTHELTTVDLSNYYLCGSTMEQKCGHVGLFDDDPFNLGENVETRDFLYFWDLVNNNMKTIQLRFYPVSA